MYIVNHVYKPEHRKIPIYKLYGDYLIRRILTAMVTAGHENIVSLCLANQMKDLYLKRVAHKYEKNVWLCRSRCRCSVQVVY